MWSCSCSCSSAFLAMSRLTSIYFAYIPLPLNISIIIAKSLQYNSFLKTFKASSGNAGNSDLVPVLLGSNTLAICNLTSYYLTLTEFFVLMRRFTSANQNLRQPLEELDLVLHPAYRELAQRF